MRKWILSAVAITALSAGSARAQTSAPAATSNQKALQLMLQKGVITQAEYDAAVVNEVSVTEVKQTVVVEAEKKNEPPPVTSKWNASIYGFIEADFIYDSTQSFQDLAGNSAIQLAYPGKFNYYAVNHRLQFSVRNTRWGIRLAAPEWGGTKSSAVLETDFFGNQPANPGSGGYSEASFYNNPAWRIRHAYLKLETPVLDFLFGQTWELFGWQSYFHPNTVDLQGVPGQIYSRTAQARISKTVKTDGITLDIAIAASRPPERDAYVPDLQGGLKLAFNGWKGITTAGGTGTNIVPAAIGASATWRRYQVQALQPATPTAYQYYNYNVVEGWGYDFDILLPIIPVSNNNRANGLTFTGSYVNGRGINDLYTSLSGGVTAGSSRLPTTADASLVGEVAYDASGFLHTIAWWSYILGLQYYFPGDGRFWISANYSTMYSSNIDQFNNGVSPYTIFDRSHWLDGNLFWDATNAVRFGLEYAWFRQYFNNGNAQATNNRVQFSAWFLF